MTNTELQGRLSYWRNAIQNWSLNQEYFSRFTKSLDKYWIAYLEGIFGDQYKDVHPMEEIKDYLMKYRLTRNESMAPYVCYILVCAERIEPRFLDKVSYFCEVKFGSLVEKDRSREDYLCYLLCGNMEETVEKHSQDLQNEVVEISKLITKEHKTRTPRNETIAKMLTKIIDHTDVTLKQFIIVIALLFEPEYRRKFIPDPKNPEKLILAKPKRFLNFMTNILPGRYKSLVRGDFSGALEFMRNVRPEYIMYE